MANVLLEMKNIVKRFPGVRALDNVNLEVEEGEIHALVGENGAGKSTLMNVLSGIYPYGSYEGDIVYQGQVCQFHKIKDSEGKGIVIIHQELALVPYLTIGENMFLGNERGRKIRVDWDETYNKADELLQMVGLKESSRTLIKDIGVGKQQLVEIAKALAKNVRLLILDEPTASLNETDSQKLVKGVNDFSEERIIKGMVGRELTDRFPKREHQQIGEIGMEVRDWTVYHPLYEGRKVVDSVNLHVRRGEVVGISGLMGAGRTELAMSIFGKSYGANISGTLLMDGREVRLHNVQDAIDHKLAYVTEDRKGNGLILSAPIRENTTLAKMDKVSRRRVLDKDLEIQVANEYREKLHTKCADVEQAVGNLSGGNQQKVLLAKWMFADPDVLILDEPTRGIDVGAKYEIYCIINQLVAEGKSVVMISSELPEVLGMCDRIYVMNEGRIVGELSREEASQESIMSCILQSGKGAEVR